MTAEDKINPSPRRTIILSPWLVVVGASLLYGITLNHWVSLKALPLIAQVTGWDWHPYSLNWRPATMAPLFLVVTAPIRLLPAAWQPAALNVFTALCAALTLGLLARSVRLLPQDRTREARLREMGAHALLSIRAAFLPALADPYAFIYKKAILDRDPHWFEKNIMGSGPFRFKEYQAGQSISGVRNPDYYREGLPYLDGFTGIFADKQAVRVAAIKSDRAAIEFRGFPPATRDELVAALGDKITVQESDWNCGALITPNHERKPFDDARVRRALTLAIDRWNGAAPMSRITVSRTVGGIVFPGSPLAATKAELEQLAGYWPDIEKSRAEARRLLKEAGAEGLTFELLNRNVDQPYKFNAIWVIGEWSKIGVQASQRVLPTGPYDDALRRSDFAVAVDAECQNIVNPLLDGTKYLPHTVTSANYGNYDDPVEVDIYDRMLRESDFPRQRDLMRQFERRVLDTEAHEMFLLWRYRIVPYRSYVKGFKISPSHYVNQDLATIWLDR